MADTPEQISQCLNCPFPDCWDDCRGHGKNKGTNRQEYQRAYYRAHRAKRLARSNAYYAANKELINNRRKDARTKGNALPVLDFR